MSKEILSARETMPGVFHAAAWGQPLEENLLELLIESAKIYSILPPSNMLLWENLSSLES